MKSRVFLLHNAGVPVFYSTIIGGDQPTSSLTLQSTSGVGTTDSILFKVGSNGSMTVMDVRQGPGTAGGKLIVGSQTAVQFGLWTGNVTPSTTNFALASDGDTYINAATAGDSIYVATAGVNRYRFQGTTGFIPQADASYDLGTSILRFKTAYTMTASFGVQTSSTVNAVGGITGYIPILTAAGATVRLAVLT